MRTRIFSILLTCAMLLSLLPATALAAGEVSTPDDLKTALSQGGEVTLGANITGDFVVNSGVTVTLDLNGHTLTNSTSDTITVEYGASLTITGSGTVDNVIHAKAAIFNNGTVVLSGGTYDRSKEAGTTEGNGGNSWYTICNHGDMTINAGVTVKNKGGFSSMVENGYYSYTSEDPRSGHKEGINSANPSLTINGGTFTGGLNSVKNDDGGILTINNGTFANTTQAVVLNWNEATINGGTFTVDAADQNCILNGAYTLDANPQGLGRLTITGGNFTSLAGVDSVYNNITGGSLKVTGGTFSSDVSAFVGPDSVVTEQDGKFVVEALTEDNAVASIGSSYYKTLSAAMDAAQDGETVVLLSDVTVNSGRNAIRYSGGRRIVVDFRGHTVISNTTNAAFVVVDGDTSGSIVTLKNGTVTLGPEAYCTVLTEGIVANQPVVVNLENMTLNNCKAGGNSIKAFANSTINVNNCQVNSTNGSGGSEASGGIINVKNSTFTQTGDTNWNSGNFAASNGGTVNIYDGTSGSGYYSLYVFSSGGTINVYGGTFNARSNKVIKADKSTSLINIYGGSFTGGYNIVIGAMLLISGGTFTSNPTDYLATGYQAQENAPSAGMWTVVEKADGGMAVTDTEISGGTVSATLEGVYSNTNTDVANDSASGGSTGASGENTNGALTVTLPEASGSTTAALNIPQNTAASLSKASSLTLESNEVGTVTLDAAALDAISEAAGDVTIQITNNNGVYTVTAQSGSTNLLPADSGTNATVTISVPYTLNSDKTDVLVFWVDGTQPEPMKTTYSAGEDGNAGTLTWTTPHLSEFMGVSYAGTDEVVYFTNTTPATGVAGSLANALTAVINNGGTIWLLKDATLNDASYRISKDVAVKSAGVSQTTPVINATVPASGKCFTVYNTGSLVLEDINLKIQKAENATATYGIDVYHGATLTMNNVKLELMDLSNGTISSDDSQGGNKPGVFELNHSTITATNIGGNFSNGGAWKLANGSKIEIRGCISHGLSCDSLTVDNSTVNVSGTGLLGVTAREIKLENHGQITVDNCGTSLPKKSQWSTDGVSYKYPVEIKKNGSVSVDSTSSVKLLNNQSGNTIYLVESNLKNSGTINAQVVTKAPTGSYTVTVMDRGTLLEQKTVSSSDRYTLPAAPAAPSGYTFAGWSDGSKTYGAGREVTIDKNTNFTAVWNYNGPTGGGSSSSGDYIVSVDRTTGGKVTVNPGRADKGDTVTITVKPNDGYQLDKLTVTDKSGDAVKLTNKGDGKYTFTMPSGTVDVKATFVKIDAGSVLDNFLDVSDNAWYSKAVEFVVEEGLMSGTSGITFEPNTSMSRAMIWTVLAAYDGYNTAGGNPWYAPGQQWAMLNGVSDGTNPSGDLTREQLAVMLWRAAGSPNAGSLSGYTDASSVSDWAQTAMAWAVQNSILSGVGGSSLAPQMTATRAQVAVMLMQFVNYMDA